MEILTATTKDKFQRWYFKNHCNSSLKYKDLLPHHFHDVFGWFYGIHWRFQIGIYEAFFEKHGFFPTVIDTKLEDPENSVKEKRYHTVLRTHEKWMACGFHRTKKKAQKEAIEVANEKFNLKYQ